jgi:RNA polymerase sigma factor (sigma-70 family)
LAGRVEPDEVAETVRRAANGDTKAWETLVEAFGRMIWSVAVGHRLDAMDASEVSQTTWLRLLENLARIEHPERVGGWLATTARNESLRMLRLRGRELTVIDQESGIDWGRSGGPTPETVVLTRDRDQRLWAAFGKLDKRCRRLLGLAVLEAPPYSVVAEELKMPVGSIGPTRARCLDRLRRLLDELGGRDDRLQ